MPELSLLGSKTPLEPLLDQASYSLELAKEHAGPLARYGFGLPDLGELQGDFERLKSEYSRVFDERIGSRTLAQREAGARAEARRFIRLLRSAMLDLVVGGRMNRLQRQAFNIKGVGLRDSTPRIVAWLVSIEVPLRNIASELSPLLGGLDVMAEHEARLRTLRRLQAEQEVTRKRLPERTRALCELKGKLLLGIERMNRAGKRAFQDEPLEARRFGVEVLERGRRARVPKGSPLKEAL